MKPFTRFEKLILAMIAINLLQIAINLIGLLHA